ncbi:His Kinase A (phospho-acceptor) domain-containing protein [Ruminococcus sp. YE71]|uniref:sensor histidine kinase n=1 Tax=unclassified Ruminococcus TaxID=2608920 RepID=UPI0008821557|nr:MULTISPECIES: ATP-binding protein [unclassified Ruminococcus]SDA11858.1 His Kinase A (phospho-acceptor) domain-containing protein [Ruminococcus sp. YE78]SFW15867.1 His Kinase A (phospho-acceptor) domain-containing protein [Ruminococcus sp. YE71]
MFREKKVLSRLEKMLDDGINGTFEESAYDETKLSKLETKWLRYLTTSKLSHLKTEKERATLKELVSDISHQTRTPISNILLYIQLLEEQPLDEESRGLVSEIRDQSEKLSSLIDSLVKMSRLETGTIQLTPTEGSIAELIDSAAGQARMSADAKNIRIETEEPDFTANFDSKWTQEALFNLIDNAVKYSPEGSEVRVSAQSFEMFVSISVSDNGIGIPESELQLIFTRFYRGREVREQNGVGIGLYLARQIAEEQGGYITAERKVNGSTFKLYLPK